jgi:hypothetical protein
MGASEWGNPPNPLRAKGVEKEEEEEEELLFLSSSLLTILLNRC